MMTMSEPSDLYGVSLRRVKTNVEMKKSEVSASGKLVIHTGTSQTFDSVALTQWLCHLAFQGSWKLSSSSFLVLLNGRAPVVANLWRYARLKIGPRMQTRLHFVLLRRTSLPLQSEFGSVNYTVTWAITSKHFLKFHLSWILKEPKESRGYWLSLFITSILLITGIKLLQQSNHVKHVLTLRERNAMGSKLEDQIMVRKGKIGLQHSIKRSHTQQFAYSRESPACSCRFIASLKSRLCTACIILISEALARFSTAAAYSLLWISSNWFVASISAYWRSLIRPSARFLFPSFRHWTCQLGVLKNRVPVFER